jgi:hypothetical protein
MNLELSWNLFIVVLFAVIMAYSFIIGLHRTYKTVIACYLGVLAADGLGNLFQQYFLGSDTFVKALELISIDNLDESLIFTKVVVFVFFIVILTIKGVFKVELNEHADGPLAPFFTLLFGFLTAGLIISTMLVYISGVSFVQADSVNSNIIEIYTGSSFVRGMVDYYNFWFSMPVVILMVSSLIFNSHRKAIE